MLSIFVIENITTEIKKIKNEFIFICSCKKSNIKKIKI